MRNEGNTEVTHDHTAVAEITASCFTLATRSHDIQRQGACLLQTEGARCEQALCFLCTNTQSSFHQATPSSLTSVSLEPLLHHRPRSEHQPWANCRRTDPILTNTSATTNTRHRRPISAPLTGRPTRTAHLPRSSPPLRPNNNRQYLPRRQPPHPVAHDAQQTRNLP